MRRRHLRSACWALGATAAASLMCGVGCVTDGQTRSVRTAREVPSATVRVSCGGPGELLFRNPRTGAVRKLKSDDSTFRVPAGSCQLLGYVSSVQDGGGRLWRGETPLSSARGATLTLRADNEETVTAGPPYQARVDVRKGSGRAVSFDLKLTDSGGTPCRVAPKRGRVANPRFTVKDGDGRVVLTGKFEYG